MRIAFIGDLQYATAQEENLAFKMGQIRDLSPDLAIVMGDIGGSHMGSVQGFDETREYVDMIGCPYEVIMGNHDIEFAPDDPEIFDYKSAFREVFVGKEPFTVIERDGLLIICVSVERRPIENFHTHNAVYVSDETIERVRRVLKDHPDTPTVLVTHAPLAGSGVRRSMPLHAAATDMYLNQTFNAEKWIQLTEEFPQIKISASAHLHMSHEYPKAITYRNGLLHLSCGVMTICARDDIFQTRFMDVDSNGAKIYTLFHDTGEFRFDAEYVFGKEPTGNYSVPVDGEMQLGDDIPTAVWKLREPDRFYIATAGGFLWEYFPELSEFSGAIAMEGGAEELSFDGERLYFRGRSGGIFSVDLKSDGRFDRIGGCVPQEKVAEREMRGKALDVIPFAVKTAKEGNYVAFDPR